MATPTELTRAGRYGLEARAHRWRRDSLGWVPLVLPGIALFAVFEIWPLVQAIMLSLYTWDGYSAKEFVGVRNYLAVLTDDAFWRALWHAGVYAVGTVVGKMLLGLGLAVLLNRKIAGLALYRSVVFVPALMSFVAVGLLWQLVYNPQQGLMNGALGALHLPHDVNWLGNPHIALLSLMIVDVWKWAGYHTILFLAGLTLVRRELLEAALVDGASSWQRFRHVTLPGIRPIVVVNLVIATAGALNTFDLVYVMTDGGPFGSTDLPITYMYRVGFDSSRFGYASAVSCVMFLVVGVVTVLILRLQADRSGS